MRREDQTPEQRAMFAERARLRDQMKSARKRAKRRAEKLAELKRPVSKTSPEYRRRFLPAVRLDRRGVLDLLAEAARNTANLSTSTNGANHASDY